MNKAYERINFQNKPSTATPLSATNLNKMDLALDTIDDRVIELDTNKQDKSVSETGNPISFSTLYSGPFDKAEVEFSPIQDTSQGEPSPENPCPITGYTELNIFQSSGSTTTPDETYTQSLGATYYGGTYNYTTGKLTVNMGYVDLGSLTWERTNTGTSDTYRFRAPVVNAKSAPANNIAPNIFCNKYQTVTPANTYNLITGISVQSTDNKVLVYDDNYKTSDVQTFANAMNGVQLAYELVTPIVIDLTPTQIFALAGDNVMWTDGDTLSVLINAIGSQDIAYDNTSSGLTATNVQDAIDELKALISALGS